MLNPDQPQQLQLKELEPRTFNQYLDGDYPQNGPYYVLERLINAKTEDEFYNTIKTEYIWTVEEYVEKKLKPRFGLTMPSEKDNALEIRIEQINKNIEKLKTAIESRLDLKEIYNILICFENEAVLK